MTLQTKTPSLESLVASHVDLVYSSALRQLKDPHLADDVTQAVFLVLVQKFDRLPPAPYLAPWLLKVTRYTALTSLRAKRRQLRRDTLVAKPESQPAASTHEQEILNLLDEALMSLAESDRGLLIRRYLQNQSVAEIATTQNLLPNTAAKKIQRALEKLRAHFTRRNITTTDAGLSALLSAPLIHAPHFLLSKILTAAATLPASTVTPIGVLLMTTTKLKLTIAAALLAFVTLITFTILHYANSPASSPAPLPTAPIAAASEPSTPPTPEQIQVRQLLYQLRYGIITSDPVPAYTLIRKLVTIGKPAVPELIAELDRTSRDGPLRALTYTLRAIDDPRAVPALIHALPRTQVLVSDYGNVISDHALWKFVTDHGIERGKYADVYPNVSIPRANREIIAALEHMTHVSLTKRSLSGANSDNPASLERAQVLRQLDAETWQDWWNENGSTLLSPDDLALANTPPSTTDLVTRAGEEKFGPLFPSGPNLHLSPIHDIFLEPQGTWDTHAYFDLDTGRSFTLAQQSSTPFNHENFDYSLWQDQLGIDVYTQTLLSKAAGDPKDVYSKSFNELDTLRTRVWPIENARWDSLESELHAATPLDPGKWGPSANLYARNLATGDLLRNQYPATFLFITPQGGRGILQLLGDSQNPPGFKFRYRLIEGFPPIPAPILPKEITPPQNLTFSPETQITLHSLTSTDPCALDLDTGKTAPAGNTQLTMSHEGDTWLDQKAALAWLESWHGDIIVQPQKPTENLFCLDAPNMSTCPLSPAAWQNLCPADLFLILSRKPSEPSDFMTISTNISPARSTYGFKTREGSRGILQILESTPTSLTFRYKLITPH